MHQIIHIIKFKLLSFAKFNTVLKPAAIIKNIASASVYVLFGIGVYFFTLSSLKYLLEEIRIGSFLLHRFISVVLFIFFMAVNAGNIIVSFSTLYKSKEVYFLISKPISFTKIFLIKFLDNFFYSSTTMLLMISTGMLAYCVYFKLDFVFIVFFFLGMLLPFMLTAASLGVISLMIMIRISFKIGLKKVVAGLVIIYLISLSLFLNISHPLLLVEKVMAFYPNVNGYFSALDSSLLKFLPNFWIADALYWFSSGKSNFAILYVGFLIFTASFFLFAAMFTAKKLYYKTWLESFDLKIKNSQPKEVRKQSHFLNERIYLTPQIDVLLKKEFLQFFREPGQWLHLTVIVFLIIIFIISLNGIDKSLFQAYNYNLRAIIYLVIFSFNLFLISSLSLRFAFPSVSLESDAFWKLRSSPVTLKKIVAVKFTILFVFIFLIGQGLNYFSHLNFPGQLYIISAINIGFISLALVSLNFGMGSIFVNLKEKSPIRLASSQGASLTFLFTIILIVFLVALIFLPIYNYYNDIFGFQDRLRNIYITSFIITLISLTVSVISIFLIKKALNRDF